MQSGVGALVLAVALAGCGGLGAGADDVVDEIDARLAAMDCLEGVWEVSESDLTAYYAQISSETGVDVFATGSAELSFDTDIHRYGYLADYALGMSLEGADASMSFRGELGGDFDLDERGDYDCPCLAGRVREFELPCVARKVTEQL